MNACVVCGTGNCACMKEYEMGTPVDFPSKATARATGKKVIVDRGDGNLFKVTAKAAERYLANNRRARIVAGDLFPSPSLRGEGVSQSPSGDEVEREAAAATSPVPPPPPSLNEMTVAELIVYADELGLQLPRAPKAELVRLIEERQAQEMEASSEGGEASPDAIGGAKDPLPGGEGSSGEGGE